VIRGPVDAPKFKDYILPLIFLKRLSDEFEDEVRRLGEEFGGYEVAARLIDDDHKLVDFYVPKEARWSTILEKTTNLASRSPSTTWRHTEPSTTSPCSRATTGALPPVSWYSTMPADSSIPAMALLLSGPIRGRKVEG
jgi:type I restriction-modification system DNA methylase subunit